MARASPDALAIERKILEDAIMEKNKFIEEASKEAANHEKMAGPMHHAGWKFVKRQEVPKEDPEV